MATAMGVAAQILQYLSALYASVWFESMMIFLPLCGEQTERRVEAAVKYTVRAYFFGRLACIRKQEKIEV
jgi:hypothetical protein